MHLFRRQYVHVRLHAPMMNWTKRDKTKTGGSIKEGRMNELLCTLFKIVTNFNKQWDFCGI